MNAACVPASHGLHWSDDGCAALGGALLSKALELDAGLRHWAQCFGAAESRFPSMIATASLAPVGYLRSFPHLATFVTAASRDRATLEGLAATGDSGLPFAAAGLEPVGHVLTPAACYHFYPRLAGSRLSRPVYLTTSCQCHRRESHYEPLRRQWCFWMRELVCIGDAAAVERFAATCQQHIDSFVEGLRLVARWQTATDSFFDPAHDPKALAQLLEPAKQELCLQDGLAIASINAHRCFFGESYDIRLNGEPAHSACVAFGIERWLFALTAAYGPDAALWPSLEMRS